MFFNYLSILSGPLIASISGSFMCLIPIRNVLKEPEYWFGETMSKIPIAIPFIIHTLYRTEHWSNFVFEKRMQTYMLFTGLTLIVILTYNMGYYYLWTIYLGFSYPLPLHHLLGGTITLIVITISSTFRYVFKNLSYTHLCTFT